MMITGYRYRSVSFPSMAEGDDITSITGGTVELGAFTDLRATASLSYTGDVAMPTDGMIRVYLVKDDGSGEQESVIATLLFTDLDPIYTPSGVTGTLSCFSVMKLLQEDGYGFPYTVTAGTNAVSKALAICTQLNIPATAKDESNYLLSSDHTFEATDSYLSVVNWLLSSAGFSSSYVDPMGHIVFSKYVEPYKRAVSYTFSGGQDSVLYPSLPMSRENNFNTIRLSFQNEDETLWATAQNQDPQSKSSTVSRSGRVYSYSETVSELSGETQQDRIDALKAMARSRLLDKATDIEHFKFTADWVGVQPSDAIIISVSSDDGSFSLDWKGSITSETLSLDAAMSTSYEARSLASIDSTKIALDGGAL